MRNAGKSLGKLYSNRAGLHMCQLRERMPLRHVFGRKGTDVVSDSRRWRSITAAVQEEFRKEPGICLVELWLEIRDQSRQQRL